MSEKTLPVIYRTTRRGRTILSLKVDDKLDKDKRVFAEFVDTHLISEMTDELSKALSARHSQYETKGISYRLRGFVTQDIYDEIVTPEKMYVDVNGEMMHISQLRNAVAYAKEKGFLEDKKQKIVVESPTISKQGI